MRASRLPVALLLLALPAVGSSQQKRTLAVEEALQIARAQSPEHRAASFRAAGQRHAMHASISQMMPRLMLVEEYQRYNKPFGLAFGALSFKARERGTNSLSIVAVQPLLGLMSLNQERASAARRAQAMQFDSLGVEHALTARIKTLYLHLFEARAMGEIAAASEATLHEQVAVADKKLGAGVLTRADVLRLQVAAANARQDGIAAGARERQVRAALLEDLGLVADGDHIEFAEPAVGRRQRAPDSEAQADDDARSLRSDAEPSGPDAPEDGRAAAAARELALGQRPEVLRLHQEVAAARHAMVGQWLRLLPEVSAEGAYVHLNGQALAPVDQLYAGVRVDWPFWEWGASVFRGRQATAAQHAAAADLDRMQRQVGIEVASRQADTAAAASAIDVSELALESAEEAFRVTTQQSQAGVLTTTDLLDAEAALTRARLNLVRARYNYSISQVAQDLAMGNS